MNELSACATAGSLAVLEPDVGPLALLLLVVPLGAEELEDDESTSPDCCRASITAFTSAPPPWR